MKRIAKIIGLGLLVLLLIGSGLAAWAMTRPPKPAVLVDPRPDGRRVTDKTLFANYFPAAGPDRKPGILLLGGSEGGLARDLTRQATLLQRAGFNVLHLAYHNAPGQPADLKNVPLETFGQGLDWLKSQPEVDPESLAIVGYSKGAEAALLVATRYPGIKAVVAGMPSSVAWDGLDTPSILLGLNSSWSGRGKKVPSLHYGWFDSQRGLYGVFEDGLKKVSDHPETVIPIERFNGNLLMICGAKDSLWPSCLMAEQIKARAQKGGHPETQFLRYAEAGHGVMGAPLPAENRDMKRFAKLGGTAEANATARADSWPKIIVFLEASLGKAKASKE